jgi:prophage tail gpP-like protein
MPISPDSETITVVTGGNTLDGWTKVQVERGVDKIPSTFSVETTERYPNDAKIASIIPGNSVQVYLSSDLILTGYLNIDGPRIDHQNHVIALAGRSKTQDLVDCSIYPPNDGSPWQITTTSLMTAATQVCKPFNITVVMPDGDAKLPAGAVFSIQPGMTAFQLIEEMCRATQMLISDDPQGRLVISKIGKAQAGTSLVEGVNIEIGEARLSDDQRFSDIYVLAQTATQGQGGGLFVNQLGHARDTQVLRTRTHVIVADQNSPDGTWTQNYATWEVHRRKGRSQQRIVTVTGWRDTAGTLWTPNTSVMVNSNSLKFNGNLQIASCAWLRGVAGTQTRLVTMPPDGLSIQPFLVPQPLAGSTQMAPSS